MSSRFESDVVDAFDHWAEALRRLNFQMVSLAASCRHTYDTEAECFEALSKFLPELERELEIRKAEFLYTCRDAGVLEDDEQTATYI